MTAPLISVLILIALLAIAGSCALADLLFGEDEDDGFGLSFEDEAWPEDEDEDELASRLPK